MPDKQHHTPTGNCPITDFRYYPTSRTATRNSSPKVSSSPSGPTAPAQAYSEGDPFGLQPHRGRRNCPRGTLPRTALFTYNTLVNNLWREFEAEIPEDTARQAALRLLPLCRGVLEKYDLTDDFADTPDYELFYTELTGTVQILLEDGIQ